MTAIILAAGRGSRLNQLTDQRPKCLVELQGRSLLNWQTSALRSAGIQDIVVVRGYGKDSLPGDGYSLIDNPRWESTNMVASLQCASSILQKKITLVSYGDIVYHPSIILRLIQSDGDLVITYDRLWKELWEARFEDPLKDAETFQTRNGYVIAIGSKTERIDEIEGQYMGLLKFTPSGWAAVEGILAGVSDEIRDRMDMTGLISHLIAVGHRIRAIPVEGGWCEVDTEQDLRLYKRKTAEVDQTGTRWNHDWRW